VVNRVLRMHVKQRVLGAGTDYVVTSADSGSVVFEVKSLLAGVGHTFEMFDSDDLVVASIHQHIMPVEPNYVIRREGIDVGEVHRDPAALAFPRFALSGVRDGLVLSADQSGTNFDMTFRGRPIARVKKELSFIGNSYMIDILGDVDIPTALCLLIVVDDALGQEAA
jgi:uncharacterized protein YxjI